jgi:hypothetical protein
MIPRALPRDFFASCELHNREVHPKKEKKNMTMKDPIKYRYLYYFFDNKYSLVQTFATL